MKGKVEEKEQLEEDKIEHAEYKESGSPDDFKTWELKKYIDNRIMKIIFCLVVGITAGMIIYFRFF